MNPFDRKEQELTVTAVSRNLPPSALCQQAILSEKDTSIAADGALAKANTRHDLHGQ